MVPRPLADAGFNRIAQIATGGERAQALQYSPDGRHLAYTTLANEVVIRLLADGATVFRMRRNRIGKIAWSPSGRALGFMSGRFLHTYDLAAHAEQELDLRAQSFDWISEEAVMSDDGHGGAVVTDVTNRQGRRVRSDQWAAQLIEVIAKPKVDRLFLFFRSRVETLSLRELDPIGSIVLGEREEFSVGNQRSLRAAAASDDGALLAIIHEAEPRTINVYDTASAARVAVLERPSAGFLRPTFSHDGQVLSASAQDGTISFWDTNTWSAIGTFVNPTFPVDVAFDPTAARFAMIASNFTSIDIYEFDASALAPLASNDDIQYLSARIVLLGDSGVGKTGLGWRFTHGDFREHESTHGRQFWRISRLSPTLADGVECEAVLWDLAGQPDYRLTHSLHLDGVDVGLLVFDASNRQSPLAGVEYWLNHLKHCGLPPQLILVGARNDRGTPTMTAAHIEEYCARSSIGGGYVSTSAKTGDGIDTLLARLEALLDWPTRPRITGSRAFAALRDYVARDKPDGDALVEVKAFTDAAQRAGVTGAVASTLPHLESHGYISVLKDVQGRDWVLSQPQLLDNVAASIVLEARKEPKGLGALDEARLFDGGYTLPELDGFKPAEREVVLHAAMARFFRAAVCFRELHGNQTLVIFPSLINEQPAEDKFPSGLADDVSYILTGAVERVYPSLTVLLGYTNLFARAQQWRDQAQYRFETGEICGFKKSAADDGAVTLALRYGDDTTSATRALFQRIVERLLLKHDIEIVRCPPVDCSKCGGRQDRAAVLKHMQRNRKTAFCGDCGEEFDVPEKQLISKDNPVQLDETAGIAEADATSRTLFEADLTKIKAVLARRSREHRHRPSCYIVYPWGDSALQDWVERLAIDLRHGGVEVIFDRHQNLPGDNLMRFTEQVLQVDEVIVIGTPDTQLKYNKKDADPVLRAELEMVAVRASQPERFNRSVIPVLRSGTKQTSFIPLLEPLISADFRDDERYFVETLQLIRSLHNLRYDEMHAEEAT